MPAEAWGLDIGQTAIHAVKIARLKGGEAEISDAFFQSLGAVPDDPAYDEKVMEGLEAFVKEKRVGSTPVVVGLPGFTTLFREFPLPAVSRSKLDEIVGYEAKQFIPYPLDEVIYDYHRLRVDEASGEISIALVCCRKDIVERTLEALDGAKLNIEALQVSPVALINYVMFDCPPDGAALILDTGARGTDFIVLNNGSFWLRSIGISGMDLTKSLMSKFSIPFNKAEELKSSMGDSKQGDRVFRVMEPILTNLCGEVQRSVGYYRSLFRGVSLSEVICSGNTYLLSGIDQFVADNVGLPTSALDKPQTLRVARHISGVVEENRLVLGAAAGLALQGVGLAHVETTLLPRERLLTKMVAGKLKYGAAAAAVLFLWLLVSIFTAGGLAANYAAQQEEAGQLATRVESAKSEYKKVKDSLPAMQEKTKQLADVSRARGFMIAATDAVMSRLEKWNSGLAADAELQDVRSKLSEDERAKLLEDAKKKFTTLDLTDTSKEKNLNDQIERRVAWQYGRLGRIFVDKFTCEVVEMKRLTPKKGSKATEELLQEPTYILTPEDNRNYDVTPEEAVSVVVTGKSVITGDPRRNVAERQKLLEFLKGTSYDSLAAMKGVLPKSFKDEIKTASTFNLIKLPAIVEPKTPGKDQEAVKSDEILFEAVKEPVAEFTVKFYYKPEPWQ